MHANSVIVLDGIPILLLGDGSPGLHHLTDTLQRVHRAQVHPLNAAEAREELERNPRLRLILAMPRLLSQLLPERERPLFRWRRLVLLVERDQLLDAARYAPWVDGFLFLDSAGDPVGALQLAEEGLTVTPGYMTSDFSLDSMRADNLGALGEPELHLLQCLSGGLTNIEIGEMLGLTQANVKVLVRMLLGKLHFRNRTEAGVFAVRHTEPIAGALAAATTGPSVRDIQPAAAHRA